MMFGLDLNDLAKSIRSGITQAAGVFGTESMPDTPGDWMGALLSSPPEYVKPTQFGGPTLPTQTPYGSFGPPLLEPYQNPRAMEVLRAPTARSTSQPVTQPFQQSAGPLVPPVPTDNGEGLNTALGIARNMFGPEGERVLASTIRAEGGWNSGVGDTHLNAIGSHGPLQFYGGGGQLNNFAAAKGLPLTDAGAYVRANPVEAVQWALNNYYGNALRTGMDMGLRGPDLAEYVQMNGQRSDPRSTAGRASGAYRSLYGNG